MPWDMERHKELKTLVFGGILLTPFQVAQMDEEEICMTINNLSQAFKESLEEIERLQKERQELSSGME